MIEINLLPPEYRKKEKLKLSMPELPVRKIFFIAFPLFFAVQFLLIGYAVLQKGRVVAIEKEVAALTEKNKEIIGYKNAITTAKTKMREIDKLATREVSWAKLINAISDSASKGIWLRVLSINPSQNAKQAEASKEAGDAKKIRSMRMDGSVVSPGQETAFIGKFIKELKTNPYLNEIFSDIRLLNINQKKIREYDVYDFVLIGAPKEGKV